MNKLHNWLFLIFITSFISYFVLPWEFTIGLFIAGLAMFSYQLVQYSVEEEGQYIEKQK
ncbi:hypothetical protein [Fictibacillus barbaricus]|uniref:Uncharacterized protein n=1 Tax=Fictibacillus barbaricus TaxID=182136 RepID=A0ABS2ZJN1_9BACL|nr:hypothetical protein [Fictibacillus barbaricus]MBN3547966.1 hypothetical protein [Fictibacillus barbaricus]GGB52938.1 hypothetical protein GCM10007199_18510 [Fictibacillus barbaricus]